MPGEHPDDSLYSRLIRLGLEDKFIQAIVGLVVIAAAASFAISALGSGTKAIITLALSLLFGVILVILRAIISNIDSVFVRIACFTAAAVIVSVFLIFTIFLIPAAFICWPEGYAKMLNIQSCPNLPERPHVAQNPGFAPRNPPSPIPRNPDNAHYNVLVFYVPARKYDAEGIVGALRQAGYESNGAASDLTEVITPDRRAGTTLIRATSAGRQTVGDVSLLTRMALPVGAPPVTVLQEEFPIANAQVQVLLF